MQLFAQPNSILLVTWWRPSKLDPYVCFGDQLSRHIVNLAYLVFVSVEINFQNLLSLLNLDYYCHSTSYLSTFKLAGNKCVCVFELSRRA